jgi:hypothetical protein
MAIKFSKTAKTVNRINTTTESTIDQTIEVGQYLRNGSNQIFRIGALSPTQILLVLQDPNAPKQLTLSRRVFAQLYYRKNYDQVINPEKWLNEWVHAKSVGATRFLVK